VSGDGTVGKACDVLDQVALFPHPVRFGQFLETSTFPKATLYRFLQTLVSQGMLCYDPDRQTYAPGMRLGRTAHRFCMSINATLPNPLRCIHKQEKSGQLTAQALAKR
tara:strand:- start:1094 stop:1417 length:324 start_codon:yes stop_codon:yes gene_type:complete